MNSSVKIIILFITLLVVDCFASISLKTDRNSVHIGESINLTLKLSYPEDAIVDYGTFDRDSIGVFEKINHVQLEKKSSNGQVYEVWQLVYTTFADSGAYPFGPLTLRYMKEQKEFEEESDLIDIAVYSVLSKGAVTYLDSTGTEKQLPLDSLQTVLQLKSIKDYTMTAKEKLFLTWLFIGIVAVIIFIYFILRRKKGKEATEKTVVKDIIPADVIALKKLAELKQKDYLKRSEFDLFATEISYITREYLENRYAFIAVELPTCDIKEEAQKYIIDREIFGNLKTLLDVTDFVKFAKYIPLEHEMKSFLEVAEIFFVSTSNSESADKK